MKIRHSSLKDSNNIFKLYKETAKIENGLARTEQEITQDYIEDFLKKSLKDGLSFVIENQENLIIAEIHCYKHDPICFRSTFSNLTLAVHPNFQKQGLGRRIFLHLLEEVKNNHSNISRIELSARQNNPSAIKLYQSIGFEIEAICKNRIFDANGNLGADIMMAWFR
jgi:putative acetyltransferase